VQTGRKIASQGDFLLCRRERDLDGSVERRQFCDAARPIGAKSRAVAAMLPVIAVARLAAALFRAYSNHEIFTRLFRPGVACRGNDLCLLHRPNIWALMGAA
jgi:hypothetical protein